MFKYKVDDVVVLGNVDEDYKKRFVKGVSVKVQQLCCAGTSDEHYAVCLLEDNRQVWWVNDNEIEGKRESLKETTSKWLKENAWYIRVSNEDEFNLVKDWLNDRNVRFLYKPEWENIYVAVGSDGWRTDSCIRLCKGEEGLGGRQELKPQLKLTLENITLPEAPKKTEQQLKLEALEATIQKAQQEIQQLKEMK